jgi:hypothetical protein
MTPDPNEVVKVFAGTMIEAESYQEALTAAGIESRVVGGALTASLGTAIPGSIELWVHRNDLEKALAAIRYDDEQRGRKPPPESHGKPVSDPTPTAAPRGHEPHVKQDPFNK